MTLQSFCKVKFYVRLIKENDCYKISTYGYDVNIKSDLSFLEIFRFLTQNTPKNIILYASVEDVFVYTEVYIKI